MTAAGETAPAEAEPTRLRRGITPALLFVFTQRAFQRPLLSFLIGYCMLAAAVVSVAGPAVAFAGDYLATFLSLPTVVAAPLFLLVGAAAYLMVRRSARARNEAG